MENQTSNDWRANVNKPSSATLKVLDGESKTFVFLTDGVLKASADYGDSVLFEVEEAEEKKILYVKANNFALLKQINDLGQITGTVATLSRTGTTKSNTRYTLVKEDSAVPEETYTEM